MGPTSTGQASSPSTPPSSTSANAGAKTSSPVCVAAAPPATPEWVMQTEVVGALGMKLIVMVSLAVILLIQARRLQALLKTEPVRFDTHWGGLGGGLGGWRMNSSLTALLMTGLLLVAFVGFGVVATAPASAHLETSHAETSHAAADKTSEAATPSDPAK